MPQFNRNSTHADSSKGVQMETMHEDKTESGKIGGFFRSSAARIVLAVASIALLLCSLLGLGPTNRGPKLKDLSDTVLDLTRQLHRLEVEGKEGNNAGRLESLKHNLDAKKTLLSREEELVDRQERSIQAMKESMLGQIRFDEEHMKETDRAISEGARLTLQTQAEIEEEENENANLKVALAQAIEELGRVRGVPSSDGKRRGLRIQGGRYAPGDNVEIIEVGALGGKKFRPAIVSDVNADGTFDLVHLEHARLEKHVRREQFQPYHVLPQGTLAFYQESPGEYLPITIVGFVRESARVNFEIHGKYQFVLNGDESNEVREGNASMIHSVA